MYTNQQANVKSLIKLTPQEIIDKEFKKGIKGYSIEEVDLFLDTVIEDYMNFQKVIAELQKENDMLRSKVKEVGQPKPMMQNTNLDILQRISNLERHVFGDRLRKDNSF